jgi:hypothetical protein
MRQHKKQRTVLMAAATQNSNSEVPGCVHPAGSGRTSRRQPEFSRSAAAS